MHGRSPIILLLSIHAPRPALKNMCNCFSLGNIALKEPNPSAIVEALLFSTSQVLTAREIAKSLEIGKTQTVKEIIDELNAFYARHNRAFMIHQVADGYQLRTDAKFRKWIERGKTVKPLRFSPAVMETLAIVAYKQPVTRAEIEEIRQVDATYSLHSLLDKGLIRITGKKEIAGRPLLYGTSTKFLEVFDFQSLTDLPHPEAFETY